MLTQPESPSRLAILTLLPAALGQVRGHDVLGVVASVTGMPRHDLTGPRRKRALVRARQIAFHACRRYTHLSSTQIGLLFGGRDHATVLHGVGRVDANRAAYEPELSIVLNRVQALLDRKQVRV